MKKTLVFAAMLAFAAAAMAQQYKWTDRNGRVQYGDAPPAGVNATPLRGATGPGPVVQPAGKGSRLSPAEQEAEFRKRRLDAQKEQEKQSTASQEAAAKKDNCARAQEHLRNLDSGQRIMRTDAKGERQFLEDADIAREKTQARQSVQNWCN